MDRQEVAQLVDALDQPDAEFQRDVMDKLVAGGSEIIDPLAANLPLAEPRAKTCIVRVLQEIGDPDAILPLMRFVWDTRESIADGDARGLAMKAIGALASPEWNQKLFQFLLDVYQDDDPFVRGYAIETMGKVGDRRAVPLAQQAMVDDSDFVQERAMAAVKALRERIADGPDDNVDDEELIAAIRGKQGGEREYYLNELRERPNKFDLADRLVTQGGRGVIAGLEVLLESEDPRARNIARRHGLNAESPAERAICLRILAQYLRGDAIEDELAIIRGGLYDADRFVQLAALDAAGVSGDDTLIERAVDATRDADMDRRYAAAHGLSLGLDPSHRKVLPDLLHAFDLANARRLAVVTDDTVRIEAYIVRAVRRIVAEGGFGTSQAQELALTALEGAIELKPLVVTALELLDVTTPEEGFPEDRRWPAQLSRNLADLLAHPDEEIRDRVLDLLLRGAPLKLTSAIEPLRRLIFDRSADISGKVVPLLERIGNEDATKMLGDLASEKDDDARIAAEAALKRLRNAEPYIDAEFE